MSERIVGELLRLLRGERLSVTVAAAAQISARNFYRDMQHLTAALAAQDITLVHRGGEYYLDTQVERTHLLALGHLLLASGAFPVAEMQALLATLLRPVAGEARKQLTQALAQDVEAYLPYNQKVGLLNVIGTLSDAIASHQAVTFTYRSRRSLTRITPDRQHTGKPGALFVDHNYFYVAMFEHETPRPDHYYLYRLDRIVSIGLPRVNRSLTPGRYDLRAHRQHDYLLADSEHVTVRLRYRDYPGTLHDAFPTARQLDKYPDAAGGWHFEIPDVTYASIKLWALSVGARVTIETPKRLAAAIREEALKVAALYPPDPK